MSYGKDSDELMRRIDNIVDGNLNIVGLHLTSLPMLPEGLKSLYCSNTDLVCLPSVLPSSLLFLDCSFTYINELPELPPGLKQLSCEYCPLVKLGPISEGLLLLDVSYTLLRALPVLPASLQSLYCSYTEISVLPALPADLRILDCSNTKILSIDSVPSTVSLLLHSTDCLPPKLNPELLPLRLSQFKKYSDILLARF
jgi:Leucine-rich repeat (LRR) protein